MVVAAAFDWRVRRIPNALIGVGLLLGVSAQAWTSGSSGLLSALMGSAVALVVLIGPFKFGALGAGDVKLTMVVGAWTNVPLVLHSLLYGALLSGLMAAVFWSIQAIRPLENAPNIPVAVPLGAATILTTMNVVPIFIVVS